MAKDKQETEKDVEFAEGGTTPMFGEQASEPQVPGKTNQPSEKGPGAKYAEGGSTKMFGFAGSQPATAGKTSAR
jgi:hypothetical protein